MRLFKTQKNSPWGEDKLIIVDNESNIAALWDYIVFPEVKEERIENALRQGHMKEVEFEIKN